MTVVSFLSLSGAPGATTLACLVASTWDAPGPVVVVECDPSGGDLAARFGLTSATGWPSLSAAVRRGGTGAELDRHLQRLPGGLPVLAGAHHGAQVAADAPEALALRSAVGDGGLAVVDLGRIAAGVDVADGWLSAADLNVLVVRDDPAAAVRARTWASDLHERTGGRLGLVVVGGSAFRSRELGEFCGVDPLGGVPHDATAAAVASGSSGPARRLERSRLLTSARRIGEAIAARIGGESDEAVDTAPRPDSDRGARPPVGSLLGALRPVHRRVLAEGAA